jgi:hypothetical protein
VKAIEMVNDVDAEILDSDTKLFFQLYMQRLIEMVHEGKVRLLCTTLFSLGCLCAQGLRSLLSHRQPSLLRSESCRLPPFHTLFRQVAKGNGLLHVSAVLLVACLLDVAPLRPKHTFIST